MEGLALVTRHTISHADDLYAGDVFYGKYSPDGRHGVEVSHILVKQYGVVDAADVDGIAVTAEPSTVGISATGALAGTLDVPRNVIFWGATAADLSAYSLTFTGTDEYGETLVETVAGSATNAAGVKAFKTITLITATLTATAPAVSVGSGDKLGVPIRIGNKGEVLSYAVDGAVATGVTVVAGLATTATALATTADVRGTVTPAVVPDGSAYHTLTLVVNDHGATKEIVFGVTPYGG